VTETPPESGPDFEAMMREIDAQLVLDGMPHPQRAIHAIMAVGSRFKISIPIVSSSFRGPRELNRYAQLSQNIHKWYDTIYGDRIKLDFSPGRLVLVIEGDRYLMSLPRIFGEAHVFASRQFIKTDLITRGPSPCNVLQLVNALTPSKAATLSDRTLEYVLLHFVLGMEAHDLLEASENLDGLIRIARGDIQTAVNNLMDPSDRFGDSKWASLQAAEKTLKAAISLEGNKFKFGHELGDLCEQIERLGVRFDWATLVGKIQCSPKIRYGEISCTLDEAVEAHHASLRLVTALANAGAKFRRGMAGPRN
jgi:hypothetical protein